MQVTLSLVPPATIVQVGTYYSVCDAVAINTLPHFHLYNAIPRFVLGVALLVLAVIPTLKQSVGMYKATGQWQTNKYMKQLVREGILYFVVYVLPFPHPSTRLSSAHTKTDHMNR